MSDLVRRDPRSKEDAGNVSVIGGRDKRGELTEIPFDRNETGIFADIPGGRSESLLILVDAKKCSCIRKLCEDMLAVATSAERCINIYSLPIRDQKLDGRLDRKSVV